MIASYALAAMAAVSAWLSMGMLVVTGTGPSSRLFALAPVWMLGVLVIGAVTVGSPGTELEFAL